MDAHERNAVEARLEQIARELKFPTLTPSQAQALHDEKSALEIRIAAADLQDTAPTSRLQIKTAGV